MPSPPAIDPLNDKHPVTRCQIATAGTVIGERAAVNLGDLNWIIRSFRVNVSAFVSVARGEAEPVIRAETPGGVLVPAEYTLRGFSGTYTRSPAVVPSHLWMVFNRHVFTPLEDAYAPAMTGQKYGLNWDGLAVFRGLRLAGFLDEDQASLFGFVRGNRFERTIAAQVPEGPAAQAAMFVQRGRIRRWVTWEPGGPVLHVDVRAAGDMRELIGMRMVDSAGQRAVESALAQALAGQVRGLIRHLQELDSDPIGFGELARQAAPFRPEVQNGEAWHAAYRTARVDVVVQVKIISTGYMK